MARLLCAPVAANDSTTSVLSPSTFSTKSGRRAFACYVSRTAIPILPKAAQRDYPPNGPYLRGEGGTLNKCLLRVAVLVCGLLLLPSACAAREFTPGAAGFGDPFFPQAGNGGYDVTHYDLKLTYAPTTNRLTGKVVVAASAMQNLSRFNLDLRGFTVSKVLVNGRAAHFARHGQELVITPMAGLVAKSSFRVIVRYAGTPSVVTDPGGDVEGWVPTDDGAIVGCEPQGAPGWYPVNDTPRDKATFDFSVTVPRGLTVMANGVLVSHKTAGDKTTWRWHEGEPMAPYLATTTLGYFDLVEYDLDGIPAYVAIDPEVAPSDVLSKLPAIVRFFASVLGPYPFDAVGAVVDRTNGGGALETQTKPVFAHMPDEATLAHELAHQWYGDSVTLTRWPDIWLHEGFATWSQWMWSEHEGGESAAATFSRLYATAAGDRAFWDPPPGDPWAPANLFDDSIYQRGAMTLQALREAVGDATFFAIMREWAQDHRYGNVSTPQFIALAEQTSDMDLGVFFQAWLYAEGKPGGW
jgi:aminopeptidase N